MEDDDELARCKALERPLVQNWQAFGLADRWWPSIASLARDERHIFCRGAITLGIESVPPSRHRFQAEFESQGRPMLVEKSGVVDPDNEKWSMSWLEANLGTCRLRASDTHGGMVEVKTWLHYAMSTRDDAPLALYDSEFADPDSPFRVLTYSPPSFGKACFFKALRVRNGDRPPFRWLLAGGERSGTGPHVDPLGTHAWVHLCQGSKLWVMMPPNSFDIEQEDVPAAQWFAMRRDLLKRSGRPFIEFVQRPGELVYVPAGWLHCVLNLKLSLAVTENYASIDDDKARLIRIIRRERPALAEKIERSRRAASDVFNNDATVARLLACLPTPDVVALAPTSHAFEAAALCSPYFWQNRLFLDFGPMPHAAAARLSRTLAQRNCNHARSCRSLYLELHEAATHERLAIHNGLC